MAVIWSSIRQEKTNLELRIGVDTFDLPEAPELAQRLIPQRR
jgi:hypothetical protein